MRRPVEVPRLWGIDVIAAIYAVATLMLLYVFVIGTWLGVLMSMLLIPLTGFLSLGLFRRVNAARLVLLWLLGISLIVYVIGGGLFSAMLAGWLRTPPKVDPIEQLARIPFRMGTALTMAWYLLREDVKAAFRPVPATDSMTQASTG